jgi:hypothetical protein
MGASIFMDAFIFMKGSFPFDFYYYYFIYMLYIMRYVMRKKTMTLLPRWLFIPLVTLTLTSYIASVTLDIPGFPMIKQVLGIFFSSIAYYCFVAYNNFDVKKLFKIYLSVSVLVAVLGVLDEFAHMSGLHITPIKMTDNGFYRVFSVMGEPYFLAVALIPSLYYHLAKFFGQRLYRNTKLLLKLGIIGLCYLLTFSAAGMLGLGIMVVFILYNRGFFSFSRGKVLVLPVILLILTTVVLNNQDKVRNIQVRFQDTYEAFSSRNFDFDFVRNLNSSTFALYSNYIIAEQSFKANPVFGSGLGSHQYSYDKYFTESFDEMLLITFGEFNKQDANSLFLRLMSETGLLGLTLIFIFVFRFFIRKRGLLVEGFSELTIINQGILIMIIVRLLRTGNYIGNGFFFFFFLYYAVWKTWSYYKKTGKLSIDGDVKAFT